MEKYYKNILFTLTTHLQSNQISSGKNIDGLLNYKIKNELGNYCKSQGYILKDTLKIMNRSIGKLVTQENKSLVEYKLTIKADVISPSQSDILVAKIDSITKMGIIGYLSDKDYTIETSPIIFIIPNQYVEDIEIFKKDMNIKVEVLQSRMKYQSKQIQVVGKYIK
jgi:hypothetical protein